MTLRYGAGLTAVEVGAICEQSPANVRKICERQRTILLERLSSSLPREPPAPIMQEVEP